jgi:hypothetical protein
MTFESGGFRAISLHCKKQALWRVGALLDFDLGS